MICVYCGEPGTHTDGDNWYCQTCWNESEANLADRRIREAEQRVVETAEQLCLVYCHLGAAEGSAWPLQAALAALKEARG